MYQMGNMIFDDNEYASGEDDGCVVDLTTGCKGVMAYLDDEIYYNSESDEGESNSDGYEGDVEDNADDDLCVDASQPDMTRTSLIDLSAHLPEKVGEALCGIRDNSSGDIQGGGTCLSGLQPLIVIKSRDAQKFNFQFKCTDTEWMKQTGTQTERATSSNVSEH